MGNEYNPKSDKSTVTPPKGEKLHPDQLHFQKFVQPQHPIWKNDKSLQAFQAQLGFYLQPWWHSHPRHLPQNAGKLGLREATPKEMKDNGLRAISRGSTCYSAAEPKKVHTCHTAFIIPAFTYTHKDLKCVNVPEGNLVFLNRWTTEFRVCNNCYINTKTQVPCSFKKRPVEELFGVPSETRKRPKKVSQVKEDNSDTSSAESESSSDLQSRSPSPAGPSKTRTIRTRSAKGVTKTKSPSPPLPTNKSKGGATSKARGLTDVPVQAPITPKGKGKEVGPSDPQRVVKPPKRAPKWTVRPPNRTVSPAPTPVSVPPQSEGETELSTSAFPSPLLEQPQDSLGQDSAPTSLEQPEDGLGQDGAPTSPKQPLNARQERPKFPPRPPKTLSNIPENPPSEAGHSETAPPPSHPGTSGLPIIVASSPVPRPTKRPLEEAEDSQLEPKR
ncbi:hypothetical protein M231_08054, partial [Tremella mesenterica]